MDTIYSTAVVLGHECRVVVLDDRVIIYTGTVVLDELVRIVEERYDFVAAGYSIDLSITRVMAHVMDELATWASVDRMSITNGSVTADRTDSIEDVVASLHDQLRQASVEQWMRNAYSRWSGARD